jgi:hypothetical protein
MSDFLRYALLYGGIKSLLRCDGAEVVEGIARYVISQHRSIRIVSRLVERTRNTPFPALLTMLAWIRCFLAVRPAGPLSGIAWIARLSNERNAIEPLIASAPDLEWTELKFQPRMNLLHALRLTIQNPRSVKQIYKIARRMHGRFEPFKAMRVVELLGYYARYVQLFRDGRFELALTSNHSNPHGIAFNLAARKCGVPVVLISHGMPIRPVARLQYDLAVVHCQAASEIYLEEGCRIDRTLTHGRKQTYAPLRADALPSRLNVGVFLCKDVNELRLKTLVQNLLANERVSRIMLRPHPKNLWRDIDAWIGSYVDGRLYRSTGSTVHEDLKDLHVVFGGNSSVLIDAVTAGVPSGYIDHLDHGSSDLHGFVAAGLNYESNIDPDFDELLRFYRRAGWEETLRRFANIDAEETTVLAHAIESITRMLPHGI